jgi:hypothetical protein
MLNYQKDIESSKLFKQKLFLETAIGKKLTEIERFFQYSQKIFGDTIMSLAAKNLTISI